MYYGFGVSGNDYSGGNGMAQFVFSDIMGDHKIYLGTALTVNLKRSDYSFAYRYLPNLIDWTFLFLHDATEFSDMESYDLIINCSCEHMRDIPAVYGPLYVLQSNNYTNVPEHINCVNSPRELSQKNNLSDILYGSHLNMGHYKRFMSIGFFR